MYFKDLEKQGQTQTKISIMKEVTMTRAETNEVETIRTIQKISGIELLDCKRYTTLTNL
jgi:hypothetical protein